MSPTLQDIVQSAPYIAEKEGLERALELFSRHFFESVHREDPAEAVRTIHRQAAFLAERKLFDQAGDLAVCALEIAKAWELERLTARATNLLGLIAYQQLDWGAAREWYQKALRLAHADHDDELIAAIYLNLGIIENIQGRLAEARLSYLESIASAVRCGERWSLVMTYNNLGMVCTDLEEWLEALVYFDRGVEICRELGDERLLGMLYCNRAEPLISLGDRRHAVESLSRAEDMARACGYQEILADVERFRARQARREGDFAEASARVDVSLQIAERFRLRLHWAEAMEERGRILADSGRPEPAVADFRSARDVYQELAAERDVARVERCIEEVLGGGKPGP